VNPGRRLLKGGFILILKQIFAAALLCALALALTSGTQAAPVPSNLSEHWVGTWASSPQLGDPGNAPPAPGLTGGTLRQIVHVSVGGKRIRVRFSNAFGASALVISSAHVALSAGESSIRTETDKALTFHGQPAVTVPAGAPMYSDPLDFDLAPLSDLTVTIYLEKVPEGITTHPGSRETSYLEAGDSVSAPEMPAAAKIDHWYFLNGVDVFSRSVAEAVAVLGDSITDGKDSTTNGNGRWPDDLARRFQAQKNTRNVGVLNEGIGGNRLLHDGLGPNALARLDRDVLAQSGVRWLIVLEGINDLGVRPKAKERGEQAPTVEDLIAAYEQIILRAHAHGIRVYGGTITPCGNSFYFNPALEKDRQALNQWIRSSGKFDAVIDFDAAIRDATDPSRLSPKVDSGDHLHPSNKGYRTMANAINLALFAR
jgi:lysophospholipase L1-like esterase